jgi:hypothetical protein
MPPLPISRIVRYRSDAGGSGSTSKSYLRVVTDAAPVTFLLSDPISMSNVNASSEESFDMRLKMTALILTLAIAPNASPVAQTALPGDLEVPAGNVPFLITHAEGTQNYVCVPSGPSFVWTFFGPQATLLNENNQQVATHFLSPNPAEDGMPRATWQDSADTSTVWAAMIASSADPNFVAPGAIPWLLLGTVGTQLGPTLGNNFAGTTYIQRVNTKGGGAPGAGCRSARDAGKKALVPYSTDYVLYRAN